MSFEGAGDPFSEFESLIAEIQDDLTTKLQRLQDLLRHKGLRETGAPSPDTSGTVDLAYINAAFERIAAAKTQEQILENYLSESQGILPRAILFLNKDAQYVPWKSLGFAAGSIEAVSAGDPNDPIVRAAEQKRLICRSEGVEVVFPWLRNAGDLPSHCVCIPLIFEDFVPVVLYGDSPRSIPIDTLELLTHLAVLTLKNNYLQSLVGEATVVLPRLEPAQPPQIEPEPQPPPIRPIPPAPKLHEPEPAPEAPAEEPAVPGPDLLFAEPTLETPEPVLEFRTEAAPEIEERFEIAGPEAPEPSRELAAEPTIAPRSEEEERYHNEARRFARLLVSEIKLYNEEEVIDGRQHSDLYRRLRNDIDRSREMYEKRVDSRVASEVDYLHEELVRILGKGDEALLGEDYPGPVLRTRA